MIKERKVTNTNAIIVFDRNVKTSELNSMLEDFSGDAIITKRLIIDQDLDVKCNLHVMGNIMCKNRMFAHSINVDGDLYCYSPISCYNINVTGYLYCADSIYATSITVGEDMIVIESVHAYGHKIIVAGDFMSKGVVAEKVIVLGNISRKGTISVTKFIKTGY